MKMINIELGEYGQDIGINKHYEQWCMTKSVNQAGKNRAANTLTKLVTLTKTVSAKRVSLEINEVTKTVRGNQNGYSGVTKTVSRGNQNGSLPLTKTVTTKDTPKDTNQKTLPKDKGSTSQATNARATQIGEVFEFWKTTATLNGQGVLNDKRKKLVGARIREGYTVENLCKAISGACKTPHNNGQNGKGRWLNLELICRDGDQVERFMQNDDSPPPVEGNNATARKNQSQQSINEFLGDTKSGGLTLDGEATEVPNAKH